MRVSWRTRPLHDSRYPFLIVDALVVDIRRDEAIRSTGVLIVYGDKARAEIDCFEAGFENALAILTYPKRYRQRLRATNLAERMNEEIRRRQRVIRIFPNELSAVRLIGSLLAEIFDEWREGICYLDMAEYWEWKKESAQSTSPDNNIRQLVQG